MGTAPPEPLRHGYARFRRERYPSEAKRYEQMALGQSPRTMVIACADSRVDPATIFSAAPGELFVVRNVAALVPPYETSAGYHGTSAAVEFAVTGVHVKHIVVLGHGLCGGISASLKAAENRPVGDFIEPWVDLLSDIRDEVVDDETLVTPDSRQRELEHRAVAHSLKNLRTFPFVNEAIKSGQLTVHGAWFSIGEGQLHWLDAETEEFTPG